MEINKESAWGRQNQYLLRFITLQAFKTTFSFF